MGKPERMCTGSKRLILPGLATQHRCANPLIVPCAGRLFVTMAVVKLYYYLVISLANQVLHHTPVTLRVAAHSIRCHAPLPAPIPLEELSQDRPVE